MYTENNFDVKNINKKSNNFDHNQSSEKKGPSRAEATMTNMSVPGDRCQDSPEEIITMYKHKGY